MNKCFCSLAYFAVLSLAVAVPGAGAAQNGRYPQRRPAGPPPRTLAVPPTGRTLTTPPRPVASPSKQEVKNSAGEEFFIIASIDRQNSQLLLKRPTEVTVLVTLNANTKFFNAAGKPTTLATFRAGDTVWAKLSGSGPEPSVISIREGEMTVADLHRYYLDYPAIK
jgi:hypothetical protein